MGLLNWMRGLMGRKQNKNVVRDMAREQNAAVNVAKKQDTEKKKKVLKHENETRAWDALFSLFVSPRVHYSRRVKSRVRLYEQVSMCAGGRHAWWSSNVGLVRKPIL